MSLPTSNVDPKQSSLNGAPKPIQRKSNVSGVVTASSSSISSSSVQQSSSFAVKQIPPPPQSANQNTSQINTSTSSSNLSTDLLNASVGDGGNSNSNSSNSTKESSSSKSSNKSNSKGNSLSTKSSSKEQREPKHSKPSRNHSKDSTPSEYDLPSTSTPNGNSTWFIVSDYNCTNCLHCDFSIQMAMSHQFQLLRIKMCSDKSLQHQISPNQLLLHLIQSLEVMVAQNQDQMSHQLLKNENWNRTNRTPRTI